MDTVFGISHAHLLFAIKFLLAMEHKSQSHPPQPPRLDSAVATEQPLAGRRLEKPRLCGAHGGAAHDFRAWLIYLIYLVF